MLANKISKQATASIDLVLKIIRPTIKQNIHIDPWIKNAALADDVVAVCVFRWKMPHESTVDPTVAEPVPDDPGHAAAMRMRQFSENDDEMSASTGSNTPSVRSRSTSFMRSDSLVPHLHAETPRRVTHHHDEDNSDDDDVTNGSGLDIVAENKDAICDNN